MMIYMALSMLAAPGVYATGDPSAIPATIRTMLDAAMASGDEGEVATIVKYARAADPASGDAVQALADAWLAERKLARVRAVRDAGPLQLWRGRAEIGGYITTGNADNVGFTGVLDATREGVEWRHKILLQADYQQSLGVTNREHYLASYEPNYKIDSRRYIYGAAVFESDRFLGYRQRYVLSSGYGYSVIQRPRLKLEVDVGPAYRDTVFIDNTNQNSIAARGSLAFAWQLTGGLTLTQNATAYWQRYNSTVGATTALNARLIGPLSAKMSYNVQYESEPPGGGVDTDTVGRASLVYSF